jgi:hypothetical protein
MAKIAERTASISCRILDSRGLKWAIWAVLVFSMIYFGRVIFIIINR